MSFLCIFPAHWGKYHFHKETEAAVEKRREDAIRVLLLRSSISRNRKRKSLYRLAASAAKEMPRPHHVKSGS